MWLSAYLCIFTNMRVRIFTKIINQKKQIFSPAEYSCALYLLAT